MTTTAGAPDPGPNPGPNPGQNPGQNPGPDPGKNPARDPAREPARSWHDANRDYLAARVDLLGRWIESADGAPAEAELEALGERVERARSALPSTAALDTLCQTFGLSPFETDVLVMAAGAELDASFAELCRPANDSGSRRGPTFGLALAALPEAHWSALMPSSPLRYWRLVELSGGGLTEATLSIDERILHYLTGLSYLDPRLEGWTRPQDTLRRELADTHERLARKIGALPASWARSSVPPVVFLCGDSLSEARQIVARACDLAEARLHVARAADLPTAVPEREALCRLWLREAALQGSALLFEVDDPAHAPAVERALDSILSVVFVAARDRFPLSERASLRFDVPPLPFAERAGIWRQALGPAATLLDGHLDQLASQFQLGDQSIRESVREVVHDGDADAAEALPRRLWRACRARTRSGLEALAQRIEPATGWEGLVLPEEQSGLLRQIAAQVKRRVQVYETWGFAAQSARGLGISALFVGPSGTGKTLASEVLAKHLDLDLYRIDLSQVVSKYIGETEKNLRRVFDAAEAGGAVLLFDEADALFGKRSEVKDSHDRYANIEISYLLQRMEAYRGLAVLTTNLQEVLDKAFLRRIRFVVRFPFPDAELRAEIWRRIFPPETPTEGLDPRKLSRLNVAGGNIRNIALSGAFLAADENRPVSMRHLLRAAKAEYRKLDKPLTDAETAGWM